MYNKKRTRQNFNDWHPGTGTEIFKILSLISHLGIGIGTGIFNNIFWSFVSFLLSHLGKSSWWKNVLMTSSSSMLLISSLTNIKFVSMVSEILYSVYCSSVILYHLQLHSFNIFRWTNKNTKKSNIYKKNVSTLLQYSSKYCYHKYILFLQHQYKYQK